MNRHAAIVAVQPGEEPDDGDDRRPCVLDAQGFEHLAVILLAQLAQNLPAGKPADDGALRGGELVDDGVERKGELLEASVELREDAGRGEQLVDVTNGLVCWQPVERGVGYLDVAAALAVARTAGPAEWLSQ